MNKTPQKEAIQNYGASSFIRKPYNEKEMLSTIHDLIGGETKNDVEKEIEHSQLKAVPEEIKETEDIDIEKRLEETISELKSDSLKKEKESEAGVEVDEMLKDALSELGLDAEEKKPLKQDDPKETEIEEVKEEPNKTAIREDIISESFKEKEKIVPRVALKEKIKQIPAIWLVVLIVVISLIATGSAYFLFIPGKTASPTKKGPAVDVSYLGQQPEEVSKEAQTSPDQITEEEKNPEILETPETQGKESIAEQPQEKISPIKEKVDSKGRKPSANKSKPSSISPSKKETSSKPSKRIPPEVSPPVKTEKDTIITIETPIPTLPEQKIVIEEVTPIEKPANKSDAPEEKIKVGDLIPIQNVDSLPVAIQKMQPTYPVIAWEARIEGEVIINV